MKSIILASASPRRKELLRQIGLQFEVDPGNCDEDVIPGMESHEFVREMSLKKAGSVAGNHPDALIIAADTVIVFEGQIIGKPHSEAEARRILKLINGKAHAVITGFTIIDTNTNNIFSEAVETKVFIKELTLSEISAYVASGEPLDKAGAYGIQGLGAVIVERLEGDYFNVMGLPLAALTGALKGFGVNIL